jgi:UDP-N-acetylmuramate--alanine ligase
MTQTSMYQGEQQHVHLVGIGGMHMSAIARILLAWGHVVTGSDLRQTPLTDAIAAAGATVVIGPHSASNIPEVCDLVVTTSAATQDNPELTEARRRGIELIKRSQMVARLMAGKTAVAVAGCHGKSTTSGLVAFVLKETGRDPTYLIGAEVSALGNNAAPGSGPEVVVEADEYDRAFLDYHPDVALVTNVEADHLDYYGSFEAVQEAFRGFVRNANPGGTLVLCADDAEALSLREYAPEGVHVVTYALANEAAWQAAEVEDDGVSQAFNVYHDGELIHRFRIALAGLHNVQNALGAIIMCLTLGLGAEEIDGALQRYSGVRRRFEMVGEAAGVLVMDDYAHHPTEIAALSLAAHARFPERRIVALFQPHTYARSKYLLEGFKACFRDFDRLFILETYAAREPISSGLNAAALAKELHDPEPTYAATHQEAADMVAAELQPGDVFFTVGAGDLDAVGPMVLERLKARDTAGKR